MKNLLFFSFKKIHLTALAVFPITLMAQVAGPQSGRSFGNAVLAGSTQTWVNTQYAGASDNQYASFGNLPDVAGTHTDYLLAAGFGFNIPGGSQITGIVAYVECSDMNGCTADYNIRIMKNGNIGNANYSSGELYLNADAKDSYRTYGSSTDVWGENWTPDDVNSPNFGIAIAAQRSVTGRITEGRIDNMRLAVYYIAPTTLPVKLSSFTAVPKKDNVRLTWTTMEEEGMDRYEIQRSSNGVDYTSFGTLICKNHAPLTEYAFTDYSPFPGTSSYRLKMLEKSGNILYSKIVPVQFKPENETTIYPSPWKKGETLFIHNPGNEKLNIQFYDASGEVVSRVITSSNQVPVTSLASATGLLRYKVFNRNDEVSGWGSMLIY